MVKKRFRVFYQSFVDETEQKAYIEQLRKYTSSVMEEEFEIEVHGIYPPDRYLHPITELRCTTQVIKNCIEAERQGYDAFIIGHFQDGGLNECKAAVDIPVLGLGETSMLYACQLGKKIGLVTINPIFIPYHEEQVLRYGLRERVVAIHAVESSVADYVKAFESESAYATLKQKFLQQITPLADKGIEVIILAGGLPMLLFSKEKHFRIGNMLILNGLNVVCTGVEMAIRLKLLDGTSVSRATLFAKAPPEALNEFLSSLPV